MKYENNIITLDSARKSRKRYVRSLEYELIASLALHQYTKDEEPHFEALLSIPLKDRVPGLTAEYGLKRMHKLVNTMLHEFCYAINLPKSKKLTETKSSVCSCDLILATEEDQLSLEDLIVFFELAKTGRWGKFKGLVTHYSIMEKLEVYRQQRYEAYVKLKEKQEAEQKVLGIQERISPEPTSIRHLFETEGARIVPFKKIG